ncbi:MAG: YidC/Oxa1 family membrane protein insertase, partial [Patescibacteria group bacterium]
IQPSIKRIQRDHRDNKERQAQELMGLYRAHRLNPFSSLLILIIQLPIFFALFQIFRTELNGAVFDHRTLLGFVDLGVPNGVLVIIAALLQYLLSRLSLPKSEPTAGNVHAAAPVARFMVYMVYVAPLITGVVLWSLPAALALYWSVSNVFSVVQQIFINRAIARRNGGTPSLGAKTP